MGCPKEFDTAILTIGVSAVALSEGICGTGEALDIRLRNLAGETNPITLDGKLICRYQGGG